MKKILITGSNGFLGAHCCEHWLRKTDWEIYALDKLSYAASGFDRIRDINAFDDKRVRFFTYDLTRPFSEGLIKECQDVDYILHLAAESISENVYIPIKSRSGIKTLTFKELWNNQKGYNKPIQTEKGEIIYTKSLKALSFYNGGQWMPINAISRHWYKGKLVELKQKDGFIQATPNHSIYSANLELTTPQDNPDLLTIKNVNEFKKQYKEIDKDLLFFLAAYITEGSISFDKSNGSYQIIISQNDISYLEILKNICKNQFGLESYITERDCSQLSISNKPLYMKLKKECGQGSNNKKLPDWIFDLTPELRESFWQYLLLGDGNIEDNQNERYTTTSYKLANQISLLLALQNKRFTINEQIFENDEWNDCWNFRVNIKGNSQINRGNKIKNEIEYEGWVYDLTIEQSKNFACGIGNVVCHNTHVDNSITDARPFVYSNVIGTLNILEFARECTDLKAFVYFSTDEVFGPAPKGTNYKEWDRYNCTNPYSATKAGAEELCLSYMNTYGVPGFITHTMNLFGERQHPEKFIPLCIRKILAGEKITIHGSADKKHSGSRFYIHARNVADIVHFLFENFEQRDKYNIVGEKELTNLQLAQKIAEILGKPLNYEIVDFHSSRPGHDLRYALDGTKLKEMGYNIPITIDESLKKTVEWTLKHDKWLYI